MLQRPLGETGLSVSVLSFGAGPVAGLMTGDDPAMQQATVQRAVDCGVNWFDTAAGYGNGRSEENLGRVFHELGLAGRCHVATKVRLAPTEMGDVKSSVRRSLRESLARLQMPRVTALQLHNSVTRRRGDEPTSITPADVRVVVAAMRELRDEGLVDHFGLTGIGQPGALREVIRSGEFAMIQMPYHLLNPSAGRVMPPGFRETNYDNLIADCAAAGVAVLAIRVFAAGALLGAGPSAHTRQTPFFPLALYQRDLRWAEELGGRLPISDMALRFVLSDPRVSTAVIGFGSPRQVDEAAASAAAGALTDRARSELETDLLRIWQAPD